MRLYAFFVLYVLHQWGALSGYAIAKLINEITDGYFSPTPGNIYPVLANLEALGLTQPKKPTAADKESVSRRRKTIVEITAAGEEALLDFAKRDKERFEKIASFFDQVLAEASNSS
ncbi:MAG TPA: PadR family transcriptional regulator [Candidatus Bathyarchaeia archaeon]|nr:PadR family transcriptional regulator [Candidatus Bathyarchaeia archaeon]